MVFFAPLNGGSPGMGDRVSGATRSRPRQFVSAVRQVKVRTPHWPNREISRRESKSLRTFSKIADFARESAEPTA